MNFRLPILLAFLPGCLLLAGCTAPETASPTPSPDVAIVWPAPPQSQRIRYLQSFSNPRDLGIRPSAFRKFMDAVAGKKDTGMIRPYAVSAYGQNILVADPGLHAVHLFDRDKRSYLLISTLEDESLSSPVGVALAPDRIFIADSALGKVFILDRKGELLHSITGLQRPTGLAFDTQTKRLYVADTLSHRIVVFDDNGEKLFEFGKRGAGNGEFNFPSHIFISDGKLLINDNMNFKIQVFDIDGRFLSSFGDHGDGSGSFSQPKGVAADSQGNIYVAGATIDRVQVFSPKGEFLMAFGNKGGQAGEFLMPAGVTVVDDHIYVADSYNRRIQIFQYVGED
jgi:DNA-binding beta-propeller fold protein YncE